MVDTPNQIGTYQRYFLPSWDERDAFRAPVGFQAFFGRPETGGVTLYSDDAEVFDMDIIRHVGEKHSKLKPRTIITRPLGPELESLTDIKYTEAARVFPFSEETFDIHASQLRKRMPGERLGSPWSPQKKLRYLAIGAIKETVRRTVRMFEILAAQSVRTGKQDGIIGETTPQFDWRRNSDNTVDVTATSTIWTNSSSNPIGDLDNMCDKLRQNGGCRADYTIMGTDGMAAFIRLSENQNLADNRRYEIMRISSANPVPKKLQWLVSAGFEPRGYVETYAGRTLWIFTYLEGYENTSAVWTPYMPKDEVIVGYSGARCDRHFGPPTTMPEDEMQRMFYQSRFGISPNALPSVSYVANSNIIRPEMFHFDAYANSDNTVFTHRTQSAPVFGTTEVDCFGLLTNVA